MSGPAGAATVSSLTVARAALGPRSPLNKGANGTIYALDGYRLPDEPGDLVYKEYRPETTSVALPGLLGIVRARTVLNPGPRKVFEEMTVWPLRVVVDDVQQPTGVLMKLIPPLFMEDIRLPSGSREHIPREIQHLIFEPQVARKRHVDVPADRDRAARLKICEQLALVVATLHGAGLVYGDLSARNVLYCLRPAPSVLLVDCDAARVHGNAAVNKQQDSPDWDPPETTAARRAHRPPIQTQATDRYKLALFVLRCLSPGRGSSINRDPASARGVLDARGMEMLRLALEGRAEDRPLARDWCYHLRGLLGERPRPVPAPRSAPFAPPSTDPATARPGWRKGADGRWFPS